MFLVYFVAVVANGGSRSSGTSSTSEDHKNEGFLKSIWHNLTNNPAHTAEAEGKKKTTGSEEKKTAGGEEKKKSDDEPKK